MLGVSTNVVRRSEHRLGLDVARQDLNSRVIRYRQDLVIRALVARGLIPCPVGGLPIPTLDDRIEKIERVLGVGRPH